MHPDDPRHQLHEYFGFADFLPGQAEVVTRLLAGRSALAVFPTGQGKSLCYQLSGLLLPGLTLVVSPLLALMKDQVDFLRQRGIAAARLDSTLDRTEFAALRTELAEHRLKLLYVAPERFANEVFLGSLRRQRISLMVIDEAHCISEWGHNFRPDYLKLAALAPELKAERVLALTATATPKVAEEIRSAFAIAPEDFVKTGFYRPNLNLRFSPSPEPLKVLLRRLAERPAASAIVYVTRQATAEEVAAALAEHGFPARPYHAGMKDEERQSVQEWFMAAGNGIVVATIAFGMGIDKAAIRAVYHYNLPKSLENYAQEIGRAGRDGEPAHCEILGSAGDLAILESFVRGNTPAPAAVAGMVAWISEREETFSLAVHQLARQYDLRPLVLTTLLTYLELEGIIEATGSFYQNYRFRPHRASAAILAGFDPERAAFLRRVLACAVKARTWFDLDIDTVIERTGATRERVVAALNHLEERGDLSLDLKGARRGYRLRKRLGEEKQRDLTARMVARFQAREEQDIARLGLVTDLVAEPGCKTSFLLAYFGEHRSSDCGHCESCSGMK
jgi:ATP-dependent DNA helicase RecQ